MTKNIEYSEKEITAFIEYAQDVGIGKAMRDLGYPLAWVTGNKWFKQRGLEPPKSLTQQMASVNKQAYTLEDKLVTAQLLLDRINEQLQSDSLDAAGLRQLADALKKTVESIQLLEGKATSITQTNDTFDAQYQKLLDEMQAKNKEIESKLQ